jgi:nucleoside 2-deoxyribosyltransferase
MTNLIGSFYVAARKDRADDANALSKLLIERGWQRTFTWTSQEDGLQMGDTAEAELNGVRDADVLIALLPGGYGTHVEIGAALALGKRVILHAPDADTLAQPYPCVFHHHPSVVRLFSSPLDAGMILDVLGERSRTEQPSELR